MDNKFRIAVIDEYPLFRDGVIYTLEAHRDIVVVGRGNTLREAVRLAGETEPHVMILDLGLLRGSLAALDEISARNPATKVLVLAMGADDEIVTSALKSGVRGILMKGTNETELVRAVRTIACGDYYVSPSIAARLLMRTPASEGKTAKQDDRFTELTRREEEILSILVEGCSNKEIGSKLELSEKTIKHHVTNILQKLQVRNRVEAALLAAGRSSMRAPLAQ